MVGMLHSNSNPKQRILSPVSVQILVGIGCVRAYRLILLIGAKRLCNHHGRWQWHLLQSSRDRNTSETTRGENNKDPRPQETNRSVEASFGEDENEEKH
ncbi:uncharacterized protein LOC105790077 isoform X2 [Gossypium raimondii]|uniref:uncharacterized protein LOC105790077 isoform X2 n=1 Tax=Gossypium raimondii TaxID=29730 RepID=UPI00063AE737|nr:uncharacterized protein LOC105790077 isoform X2 [Gossypium raimondii]